MKLSYDEIAYFCRQLALLLHAGIGAADGVFLLAEIGISPYVYRMLPYLITLIILAFTSKNSRVPKAEGIPYDKGKR